MFKMSAQDINQDYIKKTASNLNNCLICLKMAFPEISEVYINRVAKLKKTFRQQ